MQVVFVGVGEACDERLPNTSILVRARNGEGERSVLLDCGFTAAHGYWGHASGPDDLDALWISHFHGDHFFGIPALLLRSWEGGRKKPLSIVGQTGVEALVRAAMDLAYPNFLQKLRFELSFVEVEPERPASTAGFLWRFAENAHGKRDLALRLEDGTSALFYSGDGGSTPSSLELARGCGLAVHEAFYLDEAGEGHSSVKSAIEFAGRACVGRLAVVHLQRDIRRGRLSEILDLLAGAHPFHAFLPEPDDRLDV